MSQSEKEGLLKSIDKVLNQIVYHRGEIIKLEQLLKDLTNKTPLLNVTD